MRPAVSLAGPRATARRPALVVMVATAASVALLDQVTKSLALARLADGPVDLVWTLRFRLAFNSGLAFSQGSGLTPLITAAGVLLVGGLVWFSRRVTRPAVAAGLGLVLGGACANLADRLVRGHGGAVVDFIDLGWWPVFNVADMAITGGAFVLIAVSMREPLGGEG